MDSPNAMRRAQWRAVAAVVGARSRLRPLVYGAAGASAAVDAGRCVYRTQAHAASTSEYFWVYLQVVVRLSVRYLEVNPQGLRYTQSGFVLAPRRQEAAIATAMRPCPTTSAAATRPTDKRISLVTEQEGQDRTLKNLARSWLPGRAIAPCWASRGLR